MHKSEYLNIYKNEANHFYYRANHNIVLKLLSNYMDPRFRGDDKEKGTPKGKLKILDAGCGTGLLARKLARFGQVEGMDFSEEALKLAKKRGVGVKKGSIDRLPYNKQVFDVVVCADVINHIWVKDEQKALHELYRVLKPGGILILRVSANPFLKLKHDRHVLISHRYTKSELKRALIKAKFNILKLSYVNMTLLPIALVKSILEKFEDGAEVESGVEKVPNPVNTLLYWFLNIESYIIIYTDMLFGLGLISVARKKAKDAKTEPLKVI